MVTCAIAAVADLIVTDNQTKIFQLKCLISNLTKLFLGHPEQPFRTGLCFTRDVSFFLSFFRHAFSELPRPIALKLCHVIGIWLYFIIPLKKFGGRSPQKIWGPKTCKISVNFGPLQTLIANISRTAEDIRNRPALQTMAIPPACNEKVRWTLVH